MPIVTGRWGCGAFKGDEFLKFIVQWIAASEANREMVYITENKDFIFDIEMLVKEYSSYCIMDMLILLDEYFSYRQKNEQKVDLVTFIKDYV